MSDHSIDEYITQAKIELEKSLEFLEDTDYKKLCSLRSIACSAIAICKLLKSGDST